MRAYENYDEMGIYLKKEGTLDGGIGLARFKQEQRFTENDLRSVETLSRTIAHTLAIHTHADILQKERMLFTAHSQLSVIGIIIVEPPAHIRYVNPVAKDIYAEWFLGKTRILYMPLSNITWKIMPLQVPLLFLLQQQPLCLLLSKSSPSTSNLLCPPFFRSPNAFLRHLPDTQRNALRDACHPKAGPAPHLTRTERRIYELVQQGYTSKVIPTS